MKKPISKNLIFGMLVILLFFFFFARLVWGWTNPSQNPPSGAAALYYSGGNIGIGTTSPGYKLDVNGAVNASATGGLCIGGDCKTSWASVGSNYWTLSGNNLYPNSTGYYIVVGGTSPDTNYKITTTGGGIKAESSSQPAGYFSSASGYGLLVNTGNVGIGTTSPGAKLQVEGSRAIFSPGSAAAFDFDLGGDTSATRWRISPGARFRIYDDWSYANEVFTILDSGDVGIGTTSPVAKLDVQSANFTVANLKRTAAGGVSLQWQNSTGQVIDVRNNNGAIELHGDNTAGIIDFYADGDVASSQVRIQTNGNVGIGDTSPVSLLTVGSGDLFQVNSSGNLVKINNITYSWPSAQGAASTVLTNNGSGTLSWAASGLPAGTSGQTLRHDGTNWVANSVVYNNGTNVGIGTASPGARLDVEATNSGQFAILATNNTGNSSVRIQNGTTGMSLGVGATTPHPYIWSSSNSFFIGADGSPTLFVSGMSNGSIGIGTTSPGAKLQVSNGTVLFDSGSANHTRIHASGDGYGGAAPLVLSGDPVASTGFSFVKGIADYNGTPTTQFQIDGSGGGYFLGNIGIGTATPLTKLYVSGSSGTSGAITIDTNGQSQLEFRINGVQKSAVAATSNLVGFYNFDRSSIPLAISLSNDNVGIGTTSPGAPLEIYKPAGAPATSGTATTALSRIHPTNTNSILDIGVLNNSPFSGWLQQTDVTNLGLTYPLALNPNGGNVGIGTTSPGAKLEVRDVGSSFAVIGADLSTYRTDPLAQTSGMFMKSNNPLGTGLAIANTNANGTSIFQLLDATGAGVADFRYTNSSNSTSLSTNTPLNITTHGDGQDITMQTFIGAGHTSVGRVGIGTTAPNYRLHVVEQSSANEAVAGINTFSGDSIGVFGQGNRGVYGQGNTYGVTGVAPAGNTYGVYGYAGGAPGTGSIGVQGSGASYNFYAFGPGVNYGAASSIRWKNNITGINNALSKVLSLRGVYFDWDKEHGGGYDIGMIAEEVGKVIPEIVVWDKDAPGFATGMDYSKLTPLLVEAIKEQQKQIDDLKTEVNELKINFK